MRRFGSPDRALAAHRSPCRCRRAAAIAGGSAAAGRRSSTRSQATAGRSGLRGELRELPPAGPRGTQRGAAAGRQQLHEHVAARDRRSDLFEYIQSTMPPTGENLSAAQYLAVTAFILQANGAPAGAQALDRRRPPCRSAASRPARRRPAAAARRCRPAAAQRRWPVRARRRAGRTAPRRRTRRRRRRTRDRSASPSRRGEELRAGHRRDAAQSGSGRLADGAPQLPGLELQPARRRSRATTSKDLQLAWVWAMNEGGANQPTPLVHNGIIYLVNTDEHRAGARRADRRSDLGEPRRPEQR